MSHLPITLGVAIVLGVLFLGLSIRVIMQRGRTKVSLGAGSAGGFQFGNECDASPLFVAIRAQANFAEYVPFSLILIALNEEAGAPRAIVLAMAAMLVLGRLLHPLGLSRIAPNFFRASGVILNLLALVIAIGYGAYVLLS